MDSSLRWNDKNDFANNVKQNSIIHRLIDAKRWLMGRYTNDLIALPLQFISLATWHGFLSDSLRQVISQHNLRTGEYIALTHVKPWTNI
jgi:hypothetical protein